MTNKTLRERFNIKEQHYTKASNIISDTTKQGLIKSYNNDNKSKKLTTYIPYWA